MNREIKFRVWDNINKTFVYLDLCSIKPENTNRRLDGKQFLMLNLHFRNQICPEVKTIPFYDNGNTYTIQQFTGLKDVNKKIYMKEILLKGMYLMIL